MTSKEFYKKFEDLTVEGIQSIGIEAVFMIMAPHLIVLQQSILEMMFETSAITTANNRQSNGI